MPEAALLTQNFTTMASILQIVAVMIGVSLMLGGLFQFKKYGEMRTQMSSQMSVAGPLMMIVAGTLLLSLPTFISTALLAVWGDASPLAYNAGSTGIDALMPAILVFVRVVGIGSFIRGIVLLSRSGDHQRSQPGMLGKALIHILAGVLLIHIVGTMDLLEDILGLA